MENVTHTPEPWIVGHTNIGRTVIDPEDPTDNYGKNIGIVCDRTHARRIVACVNACMGLSTDALEAAFQEGVLLDFTRPVEDEAPEVTRLRAENERLRDALKGLIEHIGDVNDWGGAEAIDSKLDNAYAALSDTAQPAEQ